VNVSKETKRIDNSEESGTRSEGGFFFFSPRFHKDSKSMGIQAASVSLMLALLHNLGVLLNCVGKLSIQQY
jgi:hypothetical protein